jgi:hypothetical protein
MNAVKPRAYALGYSIAPLQGFIYFAYATACEVRTSPPLQFSLDIESPVLESMATSNLMNMNEAPRCSTMDPAETGGLGVNILSLLFL